MNPIDEREELIIAAEEEEKRISKAPLVKTVLIGIFKASLIVTLLGVAFTVLHIIALFIVKAGD